MRKIILWTSVSLDGYIETPDRDISWGRVDEELHRHFNDELRKMSAFISGRVTYELMAAFWPTAADDPANPAPMVEFSGIWLEMPKIVYSRTMERADWNTTIEREVTTDGVRALTARPGGDMALSGADLAASFLQLDLIDELRIYVHPVVIGRGNPLFPVSETTLDLQLIESHAFGNGVVLLHYQRERST